jgi:hypothetical protein
MPEDIAFGKRRMDARPVALRVNGPFVVAVLISLLLLVPAVAVGWNVGKVGGAAGFAMAIVAGSLVSVTVTFLAARAWLQFAPGDRLFADATLSGWFRRSRAERQVAVAREVFDDPEVASIELHVDRLIGFSKAIEARDARTHRHSSRVAIHAAAAAKHLELDRDALARVRAAAKLHDIGSLREPVWLDPTSEEQLAVALAGADLVGFTGDRRLIAALRHQRENFDGTGSPDGLSGDAIPLAARIIAAADVYDTVSRDRGQSAALAELNAGAGSRFDPEVVEAFNANAQASPASALRGAVAGVAPKTAAGLSDVLRGSASIAAAASIATGAVVATGVGGPPPSNDPGSGSKFRGAGVVVAAPLANSTDSKGDSVEKKDSKESAGNDGSKSPSVEGKSKSTTPKSNSGTGNQGGGEQHVKGDSASGESTAKEKKPAKAPVDQVVSDVVDTVDKTTEVVDKVVTEVVETVTETVEKVTDTVDQVVGGVVNKKK